jgi:membrane-associated phospholipid phosphatase
MDQAWRVVSQPTPPQEPQGESRDWLGRARSLVCAHWLTKMVGTMAIMTAFFVVYFWLLNHPRHPPMPVPPIFIDRMIPFQPWALVLYVSLWVYVALAPALIADRRELLSYGWASGALSIAGFVFFIAWPTAVPKADVDWSLYPSMGYLKAVDASGNAFPSLHVAFAVFTGFWLSRILRRSGAGPGLRAANWAWCLGIVYSTVATRQHVALDAVAGAVLGAAFAFLHMHIIDGPRSRAAPA